MAEFRVRRGCISSRGHFKAWPCTSGRLSPYTLRKYGAPRAFRIDKMALRLAARDEDHLQHETARRRVRHPALCSCVNPLPGKRPPSQSARATALVVWHVPGGMPCVSRGGWSNPGRDNALTVMPVCQFVHCDDPPRGCYLGVDPSCTRASCLLKDLSLRG